MSSEITTLRQLISDLDKGRNIGKKLVYDRDSKTLREASIFEDPDSTINVTAQDMDVFTGRDSDSE